MATLVPNPLRQYAVFSGRTGRGEYWRWVLFVIVVYVIAEIVDGMVIAPARGFIPFESDAGKPLTIAAMLAVLIPHLAATARRLHDIDRSGWWVLALPVIVALLYFSLPQFVILVFNQQAIETGALVMACVGLAALLVLLFWLTKKGDRAPNRFGER